MPVHTPHHHKTKRAHKKLPLISIQMASKTYAEDPLDYQTLVLRNIYLEIFEGEFVTIFGPSGSGKSTLLNLIAGLEKPTGGRVLVRRRDLSKFDSDELASFHRRKMGFVFQNFNLIKSLNVWENVALPQTASGVNYNERKRKAIKLLKLFHLDQYANRHPNELSGGEQQRVAIARALINDPFFLLVDEPTGNLDSKSAEDVMNILQEIHEKERHTIILVTHNPNQLKLATRIIYMEDGQVVIEENRDSKGDNGNSQTTPAAIPTPTPEPTTQPTSTASPIAATTEPLETDVIHTKITGQSPTKNFEATAEKLLPEPKKSTKQAPTSEATPSQKSAPTKERLSPAPSPELTLPTPAKKPLPPTIPPVAPEPSESTTPANTSLNKPLDTKGKAPNLSPKTVTAPPQTPKPSATPATPKPKPETPDKAPTDKHATQPTPKKEIAPTELVNDDTIKTVILKDKEPKS